MDGLSINRQAMFTRLNIFRFRRRKYSMFLLSLSLMPLSACHKEKFEFVFTELHSGIDRDLNSIWFESDSSGYACGGLRYDKGDNLKTTDGVYTWQAAEEDLIKALYKINFPSPDTGFVCGYDGKIYETQNSGI